MRNRNLLIIFNNWPVGESKAYRPLTDGNSQHPVSTEQSFHSNIKDRVWSNSLLLLNFNFQKRYNFKLDIINYPPIWLNINIGRFCSVINMI